MILLRNYVLSLFVFRVAQHSGSKWCSVISEWMSIRKLNRLKNFADSPSQPESISPSSMFLPHTYCMCFSWRLSPRVLFGALGSRGHIPGSPPSLQGPELVPASRPAYCWINMWLQKLAGYRSVFQMLSQYEAYPAGNQPNAQSEDDLFLGPRWLLIRHGAFNAPWCWVFSNSGCKQCHWYFGICIS